MDKVYVLTLEDVSDGESFTNEIEVYADYKKAKQRFDIIVKDYLDNNDFINYIIDKSEKDFSVHEEYNYTENHIEIHIIEKDIII